MASVYDAMAPTFDRRRSLPEGVPEAVRSAVLRYAPGPRVLDLGAGSGRIGRPFVQAGDDYTAIDLSFGMLRVFAEHHPSARLTQADGARLPFANGCFGAVLLVQVLSLARGWRHLLGDALRVLRPGGALIVGRVVAPEDGVDAQLKTRLAAILAAMDIHPYRDKPRDDALSWLRRERPNPVVETIATWTEPRSPRAFLERHAAGARFSVLPEAVKRQAMAELAGGCGDLDTAIPECYSFELTIHREATP